MRALLTLILMFSPAYGFAQGLIWDEAQPKVTDLAKLSSAEGLKILWWNVHGVTKNETPNFSLSQNLVSLVRSGLAPDIIAVGEYGDASVTTDTLDQLHQAYPYFFEWSYPQSTNYGLAIWSRYPIKILSNNDLDYTPLVQLNEAETLAYRKKWCPSGLMCVRSFARIEIEVKGQKIKIMPIHLYDVWRRYDQVYGKAETAHEIIFGQSNPLANQLLRFKAMLDAQNSGEPEIIVGDFNIPRLLLGIEPLMYQILKFNLVDALKNNQMSFPAKSSVERNHFPKMQIDHAFTRGELESEESRILPLKGSDHYPIYLVVKTKPRSSPPR